jgi:hypothetical protein
MYDDGINEKPLTKPFYQGRFIGTHTLRLIALLLGHYKNPVNGNFIHCLLLGQMPIVIANNLSPSGVITPMVLSPEARWLRPGSEQ